MKRWIVALFILSVVLSKDAFAQLNCTNSAEDQTIIEYFNEINFDEEVEVVVTDNPTSFNLQLSCPERETSEFPPSDFYLMMVSRGTASPIASCEGGALTMNKPLTSCRNGSICNFSITLKNKSTQTVYSQTEYEITLTSGNQTLLPNLNPATLPICNNTLNNCLLTSTCSLSTEKIGNLSLCESGTSCVSAPNSNSYSYNENEYFQPGIN